MEEAEEYAQRNGKLWHERGAWRPPHAVCIQERANAERAEEPLCRVHYAAGGEEAELELALRKVAFLAKMQRPRAQSPIPCSAARIALAPSLQDSIPVSTGPMKHHTLIPMKL